MKYFVVYFFRNGNKDWGVANCAVTTNHPMEDMGVIRAVESGLMEQYGHENLVVISFREVAADNG